VKPQKELKRKHKKKLSIYEDYKADLEILSDALKGSAGQRIEREITLIEPQITGPIFPLELTAFEYDIAAAMRESIDPFYFGYHKYGN
jgi:hypothetical protein